MVHSGADALPGDFIPEGIVSTLVEEESGSNERVATMLETERSAAPPAASGAEELKRRETATRDFQRLVAMGYEEGDVAHALAVNGGRLALAMDTLAAGRT